MKIILLTQDIDIPNEKEILIQLFKNGLHNLHFYKKKKSSQQLSNYLAEIPEEFHKFITIHEHFHLINKFKLRGLHVRHKSHGINNFFLKIKLLKYKAIHPHIQLSTTYKRLKDILKPTLLYDYVFLYPVFKSTSKKKFNSAFNWTKVENSLAKTSVKVFAAGGVTLGKIPEVKNLGFDGIVLRKAIWETEDPVNAFLEVKDKIGIYY